MKTNNNNLYYSLIKFMQRKGKSAYVRSAFDFASFALHYFNKPALFNLLTTTFKKIPFFVEVRTVAFRQRNVEVPFPVSANRSNYLQKHLFVQFIRLQNKRSKLSYALANSLMSETFGTENCSFLNTYNQKLEKIKLVKGNSHFRWG